MKQKMKQWLGALLSIALILGLMPGMSLTAYADGTTYNPASTYPDFSSLITNDTEVTISEVSGKTWYVIASDSSTVTLLSKESFGNQQFNSDLSKGNNYETSDIKNFVDGLTGEGKPLAGISSVISDLTLIDNTTAQGLSETKKKGAGTDWWLRSPGRIGIGAAFVDGGSGDVHGIGKDVEYTLGVRPALKLNLSSVIFSSSNTFSLEPSHPHSFTYAASGTTITATCTAEGCDLPPSTTDGTDHVVTLTLSATDASYTGNAYTGASLSDTTAWTGAGLTAPTIEYEGRDDTSYTKSTTAPTNVGTYTASITVDTDKTATANFTISPMALTITGATATNRAYDKDSTAVTISGVTFQFNLPLFCLCSSICQRFILSGFVRF